MQTDIKKIKEPLDLLNEIEAFMCFRLGAETPVIEKEEIKAIRESIIFCIEENKNL